MEVFGIGPSRKARHDVELLQKPADDLIAVLLPAQRLDASHHLGESSLDFGKRALGIAIALRLETAPVLEKLFAIEIRETAGGVCPRRAFVRQRSRHPKSGNSEVVQRARLGNRKYQSSAPSI